MSKYIIIRPVILDRYYSKGEILPDKFAYLADELLHNKRPIIAEVEEEE